jgi:DNA-binding NarL/FixJ family response regulator
MSLTPGQQLVYDGIVKGHSNQRIADDMKSAEKTVKQHVTAILKKTGHRTRCELIAAHYTRLVELLREELTEAREMHEVQKTEAAA